MYWEQFFTVVVVHLLAVASPGPDFAIVVRQSVKGGRWQGMWCALGIALGIALHMLYCLLGVGLVLSQSPSLSLGLKILAAAYLGYIGIKALMAKPATAQVLEPVSAAPGQAVLSGFLTNGLNPKATLFFVALFGAVIDPNTSFSIQLSYAAYLVVATGLWFCLMANLFSLSKVRTWFLRMGYWFDRIMGGVLIALALKMLFDGVR